MTRFASFFIFLMLTAQPALAAGSFADWLADFRKEAQEKGISQKTLDEAFAVTEPIARVIDLDRKQPESTMTMDEYLAKTISDRRISEGRERMEEYRELLEKVSKKYEVPAPVIVALWGMETSYGENTGGFPVVDALATLAYDGRRSDYFRGELLKALTIIDDDHIDAIDMDGSWAGAMGQCQFMPSSFLTFAVDEDGDGKRDIWQSDADVFGSIANYLHESGWNDDKENNFNVLLKWNRSRYFATAVLQLADELGDTP